MLKEIDKWLEIISNVKPRKSPLFNSDKRDFIYRVYKKYLIQRI